VILRFSIQSSVPDAAFLKVPWSTDNEPTAFAAHPWTRLKTPPLPETETGRLLRETARSSDEHDATTATAVGKPRRPCGVVACARPGQPVDHWTLRYAFRPASRWLTRIPAAVTAGRRDLNLEFRFRNPEAPLYLGAGPSSNFLGLRVRWVVPRPE